MKMKQDDTARDAGLEAAFARARADAEAPSAEFLDRVARDALAVQREFAGQRVPARPARRLLPWPGRPRWQPLAGLAACLVIGIGLGGGLSAQLGAAGDYILSGGALVSEGVFAMSLEDALWLAEG